jgi:hypothetical protein
MKRIPVDRMRVIEAIEGMTMSGKIELNTPAPDFTLNDAYGKVVRLSDFKRKHHIVLVFNRGFL